MNPFKILKLYREQLAAVPDGNPWDIIWCGLRYGASPNNYKSFGFQDLTAAQRSTYVTNRLSRAMIRKFNDPQYIDIFEDKTKFAQRFGKYFRRDWVSTVDLSYERFLQFLEGKKQFILKPVGNAQGEGICVYDDLSDPEKIYQEAIRVEAILEQWIPQHPDLEAIYPDAANCLRIITVFKDGKTHFLTGGITWGNGMKIANASACGIVSPVDFETGRITQPAADFEGHVYTAHPMTGANLVNIQVPYWQETLEMLREACAEVPQIGYIGWDLAITPDGPVIIEGNTTPGYRYYQIPAHRIHKTGNRAIYEACLRD